MEKELKRIAEQEEAELCKARSVSQVQITLFLFLICNDFDILIYWDQCDCFLCL